MCAALPSGLPLGPAAVFAVGPNRLRLMRWEGHAAGGRPLPSPSPVASGRFGGTPAAKPGVGGAICYACSLPSTGTSPLRPASRASAFVSTQNP